MEQAPPNPIAMRPRAPRACEVCRIAKKRCKYDRNNPTNPCPLCARRGVGCSLAASAVDPQPTNEDPTLSSWFDEYINGNQDLSEDDPENPGGST